jgi:hypothetical protein
VAAGTAVLLLGAEPVKGAATSVGGASAAAALMPDWHHAVRRQLRFYYLPQISSSTPLTCRSARVEIAHLPLRAAECGGATAAHPRAGAARRRGVYATLSWLAAVLGTARSPHTFWLRQHEPFTQVAPVWQQVALVPVPHTCAVGQHVPFTQVAPVWQHWVSQGVVPDGQGAHALLTQLPLQH